MLDFNFNYPTGTLELDDNLNEYLAKLDLLGEECHLKHAPEELAVEIPQAVDYLCQYFGFNKERSITELFRIPICDECIKGLYDPNWALLYCVGCNSSQWIWKPDSPLDFHTDVVWLEGCPHCSEK